MDAAEVRREARRRKILQNADNRMNKLLGNVIPQERGASESFNNSQSQSNFTDRISPDTVTAKSLDTEADICLSTTSVGAAGSAEEESSLQDEMFAEPALIRQRVHKSSSFECQQVSTKDQQSSLPCRHEAATSASQLSSGSSKVGEGDAGNEGVVENPPPDPVKVLDLMRCGGCLLAAFVTRWTLGFGLGILFLELALVPFALLETALYTFHTTHMKDIQLPHKNTLTTYALVLSGVKPELITKYNKVMGYFAALAEDFAVYLFSFLIFNAIME